MKETTKDDPYGSRLDALDAHSIRGVGYLGYGGVPSPRGVVNSSEGQEMSENMGPDYERLKRHVRSYLFQTWNLLDRIEHHDHGPEVSHEERAVLAIVKGGIRELSNLYATTMKECDK